MPAKKQTPTRLPRLKIEAAKIKANAEAVIKKCKSQKIEVWPVIKAAAGYTPLIDVILSAKPAGVFDSSILDLAKTFDKKTVSNDKNGRLRRGVLKLPALDELGKYKNEFSKIDVIFVSELKHIETINETIKNAKIVIMADSGDLREGVPLGEIDSFIKSAIKFKNVELFGIATNHACFSGMIPTEAAIEYFTEKIEATEKKHGLKFEMVSGGNSSLLGLIERKSLHPKINNVRVGEAIFLGTDVLTRQPLAWLNQKTFKVEAAIVECREKDPISDGVRTGNAFGEFLNFERKPLKNGHKYKRAIVDLGKKHFIVNGLKPLEQGIFVLGASSDYMILDVTECARNITCGSTFEFSLDYPALMSAMQVAGKNIACEIV